jgi:response regulator RpfG family c-di-GMP phosphodiesterase
LPDGGALNMTEVDERGRRFLVVDDDADVRGVISDFLGEHGRCVAVDSAERALERLAAEEFDVVFTDIQMGGMSGLDMLEPAAAAAPDTVFVMISALQTVESAIEAMRRGAFDYLIKPFELAHAEMAVRRALGYRDLRVDKRRYESHLEEMVALRTEELGVAVDEVGEAYRSTLGALTAALEARDEETSGHSRRVVAFSLRLGREMGLGDDELRSLEFGAMLHDVGKIGVPDAILRKPGQLTEEEWVRMKVHPAHGARILSGVRFLEGAARVVAQHHEKWEGSGYPVGLAGEAIDLNARIFAVADAFDAMTSDRVYRRGRPYGAALEELERCAGAHFDPGVVVAFGRVREEEWTQIREGCAPEAAAGVD